MFDKAFNLLRDLLGENPTDQFAVGKDGKKGWIKVPNTVSLKPVANRTGLLFTFDGSTTKISFSL